MKQLKRQVHTCLAQYPEARNSDITLTILVWQRYYSVEQSIDLKSLYYLPTQESIKRVRAQFNQHGQYLPTDPKVAKARGMKIAEVRADLGYEDTQSITPSHYEAQKLF